MSSNNDTAPHLVGSDLDDHDSYDTPREVREIRIAVGIIATQQKAQGEGIARIHLSHAALRADVERVQQGLETHSAQMAEQTGKILAELSGLARATREARAVAERAERSSVTNEVSLDAVGVLVEQKRESVRARADRRTLVVAGLRWLGGQAVAPLLVVIIAALVAWLKGWL